MKDWGVSANASAKLHRNKVKNNSLSLSHYVGKNETEQE